MARALSEIRPVPRRGLSRDEAAIYIGVSPTKFDELVVDGRMPGARRIDGRKVWDVRELDLCFDEPHDGGLPPATHGMTDDPDQASLCP